MASQTVWHDRVTSTFTFNDCCHETKRHLLLERKAMANLDSVLESRDITLLKNIHVVSSVAQSCPTLCNPMDCSTPGLPVHHQLPEFTQTHVHWVSDTIQPSHPLLSPCPPAFNLSQHQGLFQESVLHIRWPKHWNFSFSISPSNEYSGLISFRMNWFDFLAVQGTLKSFLQFHSSKTSVLWHSAFFMVQLSHPYVTTGTTIALTKWTFVSKVTSLLFNMLSRLVLAFLPRRSVF